MGLKGCKWSSLNAPGTQTPFSYDFEIDFSPGTVTILVADLIGHERRIAPPIAVGVGTCMKFDVE